MSFEGTISHRENHDIVGRQNRNLVTARFFNHTVLNQTKSASAGRPMFDDMECCEIRTAGNNETIPVFPAHVISHFEANDEGFDVPITYAMRFSQQYRQFKASEAQTKEGTPLSEAKFLTEAQKSELRALAIYTIDALAMLEGKQLKILGMHGRKMKDQAQAFIDSAGSTQTNTAIDELMATVKRQQAELDVLTGAKAASVADKLPPEDADEDEKPSFIGEPDKKTLEAAFIGMSDAQLKELIATSTGDAPRGKLTRDRLLLLAHKANQAVMAESEANAARRAAALATDD